MTALPTPPVMSLESPPLIPQCTAPLPSEEAKLKIYLIRKQEDTTSGAVSIKFDNF
jgi:hypothetical protein